MTITAKYGGTCTKCGGAIRPGDKIEWKKGEGSRHAECPGTPQTTAAKNRAATRARAEKKPADTTPAPYHLGGGSGNGCQGWEVGQVIATGEKRRRAGEPDALVVVRASRRYVREDGLSFGVGDDEGYLYSADCRAATPEELAGVIERLHGEAIEIERARERKRLEAEFDAAPWLPEAEANRLADAQGMESIPWYPGVHGSGRLWVVVESEFLALVSGGHYDDYRRSAHRLPRTPELEARIRALASFP